MFKIQGFRAGNLSYAVIDDFYTPEELTRINVELGQLLPHAESPQATAAAGNRAQGYVKKGGAVWLSDHPDSVIAQLSIKLRSQEVVETLYGHDVIFVALHVANSCSGILNYYQDSDYYGPHMDNSTLTAVTMFRIGEFTGGDFWLPQQNVKVEFKENRVVIFPGCAQHKADSIQAATGNYRVTMAQFFNYKV
jgi:hypothetical protein